MLTANGKEENYKHTKKKQAMKRELMAAGDERGCHK